MTAWPAQRYAVLPKLRSQIRLYHPLPLNYNQNWMTAKHLRVVRPYRRNARNPHERVVAKPSKDFMRSLTPPAV